MAREPRFARCLVVDDVVLAWRLYRLSAHGDLLK
jgi:hypothetical protein